MYTGNRGPGPIRGWLRDINDGLDAMTESLYQIESIYRKVRKMSPELRRFVELFFSPPEEPLFRGRTYDEAYTASRRKRRSGRRSGKGAGRRKRR